MRGNKKKNRKGHKLIREAQGTSQPYGQRTTTNPHLKALILEVVEDQIREGDPPETRQMYERLVAAGYERKQAIAMIGSAAVEENSAMLHEQRPFDRARFTTLLEQLN